VYPGYVFDLDGTVYLGDSLLPQAGETIRELRRRGSRTVFVTNKPLETADEYADKLTHLGIATTRADVVTSVDALVDYLRREHPRARLLPVAEVSAIEELEAAGFSITKDPSLADVVVVSFDRTFDYEKLNAAFQAVRYGGAAIVATNPDPFCPTPEGGIPDCAAMLAAIEACSGASAEAVVGKPSVHMARALLGRLGMAAEDVAVVGDRLLTDMAMARSLGMTGVLVLTGATKADNLFGAPVQPHHLIGSLCELLPEGLSPDEPEDSSLTEEESG
jgi:NagD protein